jgi:hypothetical protein
MILAQSPSRPLPLPIPMTMTMKRTMRKTRMMTTKRMKRSPSPNLLR